ncbi:pentapeptide repeat-containing protein [Pectobacterium polaris]|uniref:Pentapeptide repeat-containing protein n=1 Tax=Pectobacterium polaris TaxID=2042057 RepID=A0AAW4NZG7_9GAMM|nr:pentapeptide repeat-containing protein [Pectobacterium polaris]MBW5892574.1 pentapeptide repeat-containing protein [Pectobacterium polaris]
MGTTRSFAGKWRFATASDLWVTTRSDGVLVLSSNAEDASAQWLNAYAETSGSPLWLQGTNGLYVSSSATPQADQERGTSVVAQIRLEADDSGAFRLRRLGTPADSYLSAAGTSLQWVPVSTSPSASTLFTRSVITQDLAVIQAFGAMGGNLRHAWLSDENLDNCALMAADLSDADLHGATLVGATLANAAVNRTLFVGCDLSKTDMSNVHGTNASFDTVTLGDGTSLMAANLPGAVFRGCNATGSAVMNGLEAIGADFSGASLPRVILNNAILHEANLVNVNLEEASLSAADFSGAIMTRVNLQQTTLQSATFVGATLVGTRFDGADINHCNFAQADLTNALLSKVTGASSLNLSDSILTAANLSGLDLRDATITAKTNFTQSVLDEVNLRGKALDGVVFYGASLKRALLDNTSLSNAVLVAADLSGAKLTGNISLVGANLSNASLADVDLTGAQFGALSTRTSLESHHAEALDQATLPIGFGEVCAQERVVLNGTPRVTVRQPGEEWLIEHGGQPLFVRREAERLVILQADARDAAILANIFMPNAILTNANLYAVDMSGAHWYGSTARADNANLEQVNLSNANLATMDFTQARLYGANLSYANLVNAVFRKAMLSPTQGQKPSSLAFASMQGADFGEAHLGGANLTNAAVSLDLTVAGQTSVGTPIFTLDSSLRTTLNSAVVSAALRQAFVDSGYPLLGNATITVKQNNASWLIANAPPGSDLSYRGYLQFIVLADAQPGSSALQVYGGNSLRIVRTGAGNTLEPVVIAFGATVKLQSAMNASTTCPSGLRYSMLGNGITYVDLMTGGLPPHPPKCIPSPTTWCT